MSMGLDPLRSVRDVTVDQYKAGMGEYLGAVASDAWANGPLSQAGRVIDASAEQAGAEGRGEQLLSIDDANAQGRDLGLRFDQPIARGAFDVLAGEKQRQAAAESTFKRARLEDGYGTLHWLLAGGTEFLTMAADPLNLASAFVPVVGEARYAAWAARLGRLPAGLLKGAAEGAGGQALLEPLAILDRRAQGESTSMGDVLTDLAFGSGLGVVLHGAGYGLGAGFRFLRDRYVVKEVAGRAADPSADLRAGTDALAARDARLEPVALEKEETPPPRQPVAEAMETLRPEIKDAALRTAIAQLGQDRPVDIEPVLRADPSWPQVQASIDEMQAHQALQAEAAAALPLPPHQPPADFQPTREELGWAQRAARGLDPEVAQQTPERLADFVRRHGGIAEDTPEGGDLVASDIKDKGLVRPSGEGRSVDHLAVAAQEAGFRVGESREGNGADVRAFMDALIADASGAREHMPQDEHTEAWRAQQEFFDNYRQYLKDGLGLDPRGMDPRQLAWLLRQDETTGRLMSLVSQIDRLGDHASLELAMRLEDQRVALEREVLATEPGAHQPGAHQPGAHEPDAAVDHHEMPAATLEELERYYADHERAAGQGEAGQPAARRQPGAGRPGEGGQAAAARPAGHRAAPEGAGLRPEARPEGAEGAARGAADVTGTDAVIDRIVDAFDQATGGARGQSVSLEQIRALLPDIDRATLDAALLAINRFERRGASLMQSALPASRTTEAFRAAAVSPAGDPRELLWLSSRARKAGDAEAAPRPAAGPAPTPDDLANFAERQQGADLHADPDALAQRDDRLAGEAREVEQLLADTLKDYGALLDEPARHVFEETGRVFDDEAKAIDALAACQMGGR